MAYFEQIQIDFDFSHSFFISSENLMSSSVKLMKGEPYGRRKAVCFTQFHSQQNKKAVFHTTIKKIKSLITSFPQNSTRRQGLSSV